MQLGGKPPKKGGNLFDEDFASGFEDSKFDKFKPLFKALAILVVVVGLAVGGLWLYGNNASKNNYVASDANGNNLSESYKPVSGVDETATKFNNCTTTATGKTKDLQTSDPDFSKKLIAGYDEWLACYDEFPDQAAEASPSRSSLELARKNAIDSSGAYKDTYTSSNSYEYTPSAYTPTYNPDKYDAYKPDSSPSANNTTTQTPSYTPPSSSSGSTPTSDPAAERSAQESSCRQQVAQQTGGTSLNQSQRDQMVAECMRNHGY